MSEAANNIPTPRFTGLFIPAEIFEIEGLTLLDQMLLAWIDALYSKDHKGCFAGNKYFADKLKVKLNTIDKAVVKLKKMGLVETVSFDGRHRVMRSLVFKRVAESQSSAALDLNPVQTLIKIQTSPHPSYKEYRKGYRKEVPVSKTEDDTSGGVPAKGEPPEPSKEAIEISNYLLDKILKIHVKLKKPNIKKWANVVDLMILKENRTPHEIREVIDYVFTHDSFWVQNIQSTDSLRRNFDKLWIKAHPPTLRDAWIAKNRSIAKEIKAKVSKSKALKKEFFIGYDYVTRVSTRESALFDSVLFDQNPRDFLEKIGQLFELDFGLDSEMPEDTPNLP